MVLTNTRPRWTDPSSPRVCKRIYDALCKKVSALTCQQNMVEHLPDVSFPFLLILRLNFIFSGTSMCVRPPVSFKNQAPVN